MSRASEIVRAASASADRDYISPRAASSVLVTIDMQNDFTLPGAVAEIAGTGAVVANIARMLSAYRAARRPIVHMIRLYAPDGSNVDPSRRELLQEGAAIVHPGSEGAELVRELKPAAGVTLDAARLLAGDAQPIGDNEWVRYKPRWGAFYQTSLEQQLHRLGVDTIVLAGCNFPNCPRTSLYEASERDFRLALLTDAISGIYEKGLQEMRGIGITLKTTDEAIGWIGAGA